ncbi:MAG: hypothetical protein JW967_08100 [Dehalococcoidales bacterium]|nr:hypothetical protein [Dehalococcoidales bacterium]
MAKKKYEKNLVTKPAREIGAGKPPMKGREIPTMTYMSDDLVPGSKTYIELGWIWDMPSINPHILEHSHDYNEIVLHFGSDHENPEDLGAEIEFVVGGEPIKINKTSAIYIPKGVKHGPLTWKKVNRPHIEMTIMLGAGTLAEAAPGGYKKKKK